MYTIGCINHKFITVVIIIMQHQLQCEDQEIQNKMNDIEIGTSELARLESEISVMEERVSVKTKSLEEDMQSQGNDVDGEILMQLQIEITNLNIELVHLRLRTSQAKFHLASAENECCQMKKTLVEKKQLLVR